MSDALTPTGSLTRYDIYPDEGCNDCIQVDAVKRKTGEWVRYDEADAALTAAEARARTAEEALASLRAATDGTR